MDGRPNLGIKAEAVFSNFSDVVWRGPYGAEQ